MPLAVRGSTAGGLSFLFGANMKPSRLAELQKMPYAEYLQTPEWKRRRKAAVAFAGGRCQLCNSDKQPLHAHHRTYENRGAEMPQDIVMLCADCHKKFHRAGGIGSTRTEHMLAVFEALKVTLRIMKRCGQTHDNPIECHSCGAQFDYMDCCDTGMSSPISAVLESLVLELAEEAGE